MASEYSRFVTNSILPKPIWVCMFYYIGSLHEILFVWRYQKWVFIWFIIAVFLLSFGFFLAFVKIKKGVALGFKLFVNIFIQNASSQIRILLVLGSTDRPMIYSACLFVEPCLSKCSFSLPILSLISRLQKQDFHSLYCNSLHFNFFGRIPF